MNILNKLTIKHLKMNKKRTLVTIIGITLSTALMVGIGLLVSSFLTTQRLDAEKSFGSFHTKFDKINQSEYEMISKNVNMKNFSYYTPIGSAKVNSKRDNKPYLYIAEGNKEFLNNLTLVEGTLPTNDKEIVISKHAIKEGGLAYKIGDTITLEIGARVMDGEELELSANNPVPSMYVNGIYQIVKEDFHVKTTKSYKVVGIVEKTIYESYSAAGFMAFSYNDDFKNDVVLFVEYKKPKKAYDYSKEIASFLDENSKEYQMNENLLYYYGATKYDNVNDTFLPLILIALSVISIGCIIVIYNSFAISTMERKKSFGLYASIGTTMKQIKKTVLFEAFIVGLIGIILGIAGGFLGIYLVIQIINHLIADFMDMNIVFSVEPLYLIIPLIFMVFVIFLSAYLPAKRSSKVTPIEAIRGNDDIKISPKEVKTPKFIRKFFGIEGDIAYKNMKRNKKKYRITIISLFISIVMFNTFTSFLNYMVRASATFDYYDYDISLNLTGDIKDIKEDISAIKRNYNIDKSTQIIDQNAANIQNFNPNSYTNVYKNLYDNKSGEEKEGESYQLYVLSDADYNKITDAEGLLLNTKYFTSYNNNSRKTKEVKVFKNKSYDLEIKNSNRTSKIHAEVTSDDVFGFKNTYYQPTPVLIISETTYKEKFDEVTTYDSKLILNTKDYKKIADAHDNNKLTLKTRECFIDSPAIEMANERNLILAIKILFYGFITLVTLIGVTSVINTINTSINLRRKEFAMLRSIGLTPKGFNRILFFESLLFGLKSLFYGIPVSIGINALISTSMNNVFTSNMIISWKTLLITIIAVFIIVIISMNYASKKIKKENILEALREENI